MKTAYLIWLAIFVWMPLIGLWAYKRRLIWRYRKTLGLCILGALVFSVPWYIWAVSVKLWMYPPDTNIGIILGNLPLEEYLFIIFVTLLFSTLTLLLKDKFRAR